MGNALAWLGEQPVPDTARGTYFNEELNSSWTEVLCCPCATGCLAKHFDSKHSFGGEARYKVKLRLSHNEHVPRYQVHVVDKGTTKQWVVGHLEKTETHLRAKPGEFIRVQVWKITCSMVEMEHRRSALHRTGGVCGSAVKLRPTPSSKEMQMMAMTIATQAKRDQGEPDVSGAVRYDETTERWVQTITVDNPAYRLVLEPPQNEEQQHALMESMNVLRVTHRGEKVAVARKQRFAGALGKVCQPYLGVQIKPSQDGPRNGSVDHDDLKTKMLLQDPGELMLMLLCLAWSEETMSPTSDLTDRFVHAMRAAPHEQGSAEDMGVSVQWDVDDVQKRCPPGTMLHDWDADDDRFLLDDEDEDGGMDYDLSWV